MKNITKVVLVLLALSFFLAGTAMAAEKGKMETATGKVTAIDPEGKGIVIGVKSITPDLLDVGCVIDKDTVIKVNGKKATLKDIKVGDTVTIRYLRSSDLFAKEIIKK